MDFSSETFYISKQELDRRVNAYTRLCLSCLLGTVISLLILKQEIGIILIISFVIISIFIVTRLMLIRFFNTYKDAKYLLSEKGIERFVGNKHEVYLFENIEKVKTVYTSNNLNRSIHINCKDRKGVSINALVESDKFLQKLKEKLNKEIFFSTTEPIDYDHKLFYVFLGLGIGIISVVIFNFLANQTLNTLKTFSLISAAFSILLGIYFLISKPIAKYYGNRNWISDFILGLVLITGAILIFSFLKFLQ